MTIIIKAINKASEVAQKVGSDFTGQGNKIVSAMDKARQAGDRFTESVRQTGPIGMSSYAQLTSKQQEYIQGLSKSQGLLDRLGISGTNMGNALQAGYNKVNSAVTKVKSGVDTLKSKIESTTVGSKLITGFNSVKTKVSEVTQKIRTGLANGLDTVKNKVENITNSMGELGTAVTSVFGALGMGSIYEATIGLAMTREQMTSLMTATMGSADAAQDFVSTLDTMTNSSLVSLNDLGNAMAKIKMSTGMTNDQLKLIAPTVNDIGQRAILMGKSTQEAQDLMVASFRGLNGEFDMLKTNFGITRQNLLDAGWSGAADDVEGYNKALQTVLENGGSMDEMLKTTPGQIALVKKAFSTAGREIGEIFIPAIQTILSFMIQLKETNPWVFKLIIIIGALVSGFALLLPVMGSIIGAFQSFLVFMGLIQGAENATTISTVANTAAKWLNAAATTAMEIASKAAAGAQMFLNAVMSANPIAIVVLAIVALIAILWYLYNTNEGVRNAIDWLWSSLQQLAGFLVGHLQVAWKNLMNILGRVWQALQDLGNYILGGLMSAWNSITSALSPITNALGRLWNAIAKVFGAFAGDQAAGASDAFGQIASAAQWLWGILSQVAGVIMEFLSPHLQVLGQILTVVAGIVYDFFVAAWTTVSGIIMGVIEYIATFINILADLIEGNITAGQALQMIWDATKTLFVTVFNAILQGIGKFALDLVNKGVKAAQDFFNGVVNWIMQLPGQIWAFLLAVIDHAGAWKDQMVAKAKAAGMNFINSVIDFISQLPGKVWTYLLNTISKVIAFASQAYANARVAGSNIINAIASYLTSLPGKMYQWGVNAINSFINAIINSIPGLRSALDMVSSLFPHSPPKEGPLATITESNMESYGESLGEAFADGINTTTGDVFSNLTTPEAVNIPSTISASTDVGVTATTAESAVPSQSTTGMNVDTGVMVEQNQAAQDTVASTVSFASAQYSALEQTVSTAWASMATTTQTGFNTIKTNMQTTLNEIVANNQAGYTKLKNTTTSTIDQIVLANKEGYASIQQNMSDTLTNIVADNTAKYDTIYNTTKTTLDNLQTKTDQSMTDVKQSWNSMRDSLISAANKVDSQVTSQISHLSSNIATFYRKIQNPILFLAGPMPYRYRKSGKMPSMGHAGPRQGKFAGPAPVRSTNSNQLSWLNSSPGIPCSNMDDCYYAGWDYSDPWISTIMKYIKSYRPIFGDLGNMDLTVGDFENSTMPIMGNMTAFEAVARKLISGTSYSFYYNSRYGSPYAAAASGSFNCYDGALIMLALANAFGLGGYMASGCWGDVGHVWAVIGGKTFDTTAFQGGYGWSSPKVHACGPGPDSFSTSDTGVSNSWVIEDTLDLNLTLQFEGLPDSMDEESLKSWLMSVINDSELVKKLVKDRNFVDRLRTEFDKTDRRDERANGS